MTCVHHWRLGEGPRAEGVCRKCGARRTFKGMPEYVDWHDLAITRPGNPRFDDMVGGSEITAARMNWRW